MLLLIFQLMGLGVVESDAMAQAKSLETSGDFGQAVQLYMQVAANSGPDRALAFVRAGWCYEKLIQPARALSCYDQLLEFDDKSYWAETALARKADLSFRQSDPDAARACITKLEEMFPDSPWTVCGRVTAAKLEAGNVQLADTTYVRELQALDAYVQALNRGETDDRLQGVEEVIARYPDSATATRAYESKACLLPSKWDWTQ